MSTPSSDTFCAHYSDAGADLNLAGMAAALGVEMRTAMACTQQGVRPSSSQRSTVSFVLPKAEEAKRSRAHPELSAVGGCTLDQDEVVRDDGVVAELGAFLEAPRAAEKP
jgi:hypothetical protein